MARDVAARELRRRVARAARSRTPRRRSSSRTCVCARPAAAPLVMRPSSSACIARCPTRCAGAGMPAAASASASSAFVRGSPSSSAARRTRAARRRQVVVQLVRRGRRGAAARWTRARGELEQPAHVLGRHGVPGRAQDVRAARSPRRPAPRRRPPPSPRARRRWAIDHRHSGQSCACTATSRLTTSWASRRGRRPGAGPAGVGARWPAGPSGRGV